MTTTGVEQRITGARRRVRHLALGTRDRVARLTATPRRWLQPVTDVTSPAAAAVGVVALVAGIVGWRLGWRELVLGFWLGLVLLAVCALFVLGRHQLSARFDLGRDRVVVGERANGAIFVVNGSRRRSLPVTVELPVHDRRRVRSSSESAARAGSAANQSVRAITCIISARMRATSARPVAWIA